VADRNYITPEGCKRLVEELSYLGEVERPRVCREVSEAAAEGDRSENASYIYGKRRLREIDRRMRFLTLRLRNVQVVDVRGKQSDKVYFGATVTIEDDDGETHTYRIVGTDEFDVKAGRVSWLSPIGKALLGKQIDDTVIMRWQEGERRRELTITDIQYEPPAGEPVAAKTAPKKKSGTRRKKKEA